MLGQSFKKSTILFFGVFVVGFLYLISSHLSSSNEVFLVGGYMQDSNFNLLARDFFLIATLLALVPLIRNQYFFQNNLMPERKSFNISILIPFIFTSIQLALNFVGGGGISKTTPMSITSDNLYQFVAHLVWIVFFGTTLRMILSRFISNFNKRVLVQIAIFFVATVVTHLNYGRSIDSFNTSYFIGLLPRSIDILVIVFENICGPYILIFGSMINFLTYGFIAWSGYSIGSSVLNIPIMYVVVLLLSKYFFKKFPPKDL